MSTQVPETQEAEPETEQQAPSKGDERRAERRRKAAERERERQAEEAERAKEDENTVELKVFRYDPEVPEKEKPRFDSFHVPFEKGMTVLDALMYARDTYDSSLTFRHSCRQAICGSDALFINGRQRLGCKTQLSDLESTAARL